MTREPRRYCGEISKMTWENVVVEKRRIQTEAITNFATSGGNTESKQVDCDGNVSKPALDGEILREIASAKISSEALVTSRIRK